MISKMFLSLSVLLLSSAVFAKVQYLKLGPGKVMAFEHVIKSADAPTLILLPGVNRSLALGDRSVQLMAAQGWNLLMPSLSAHPLSLRGLGKYEIPHFVTDTRARSKEFAADINALATALKIEKAIPVTLSYSSSIGAYLDPKKFPHVIETVPLGTAMEANPEAAKTAEQWESWLRMNPFMASIWIRQSRDAAYAAHWGKVVEENLQANADFYGPNPRVSDIKSGYVAIARAVEDFNFPQWNFNEDSRTRDFVFAEKEDSERLKNQLAVLKNYIASGKPVRVIVVASAGHVLPSDRPAIYAGAIGLLASQPRMGAVQFAFVDSVENLQTLKWQDQDALSKWLKDNSN